MLPVVEQLANPALKDRHWQAIFAMLDADKPVSAYSRSHYTMQHYEQSALKHEAFAIKDCCHTIYCNSVCSGIFCMHLVTLMLHGQVIHHITKPCMLSRMTKMPFIRMSRASGMLSQ